VESAFKILEDMKKNDVPPNDMLFGTLLTGMFLLGDMENVGKVLELIKEQNFYDSPHIQTILETYKAIEKKSPF
jgi:hypothetical protein